MKENECSLIQSNLNQSLSAANNLGKIVLEASLRELSIRTMPGDTNGSIGIDVDGKYLIVGDALMNMFYPTVLMLYFINERNRKQ